jgi:hypothetical protein
MWVGSTPKLNRPLDVGMRPSSACPARKEGCGKKVRARRSLKENGGTLLTKTTEVKNDDTTNTSPGGDGRL